MNGRFWAELWMVLILLLVVTGLLAHAGADLQVSALFYHDGSWPIGEQFPWKLLYRIDRTPALLLAVGWLVVVMRSYRVPALIQWRRAGVFVVLLLILGPGLLVNSAFKGHWGRPRPREIVQHGGTKQFLQPWQPGISGKGRSFPSGHSSAAFFLAAPWFVYRDRKPARARIWLLSGIGFGSLMSIARMAQGGHFLTDCLWAFGLVWLTGQLLSAWLLPEQEQTEGSHP